MPALRQREPGFAGLAAIVCGQQLSTASAGAIWARLAAAFDPFDHDVIRKARAERLGRLGLSAAKIKTLKNIARELAAERLNLDVLAEEDADAAHNTLTALHGIGPWTADVYLLFCLGHGDAWPAGDIAIQEAVKIGLGLPTRPTAKQMAPAGGAVASPARCGGASVVELLPCAEEARGRAGEVGRTPATGPETKSRKQPHAKAAYCDAPAPRSGRIPPSPPQPHPVLARASRDKVDHRAYRRQIDQIGMRQQPDIGHARSFCGATRTRSG